jgi:hypothetical protein
MKRSRSSRESKAHVDGDGHHRRGRYRRPRNGRRRPHHGVAQRNGVSAITVISTATVTARGGTLAPRLNPARSPSDPSESPSVDARDIWFLNPMDGGVLPRQGTDVTGVAHGLHAGESLWVLDHDPNRQVFTEFHSAPSR